MRYEARDTDGRVLYASDIYSLVSEYARKHGCTVVDTRPGDVDGLTWLIGRVREDVAR